MTKNDSPDILAPNVEAGWRNDFIVELRVQGASGRAIADALVEVETHCNESGQSAIDAFGPAVRYAKALDLPDESRWTRPQLLRIWVQLILFVGAVWTIPWGAVALFQGRPAEIYAGSLVSGGATIIASVFVFVFGDPIIRFIVDHVVWAAVVFAVVLAVLVGVGLPFDDVRLGSVPALAPLVVGIAALVAWAVFTLVLKRTGKNLDDPLIAPDVPVGRDS